MGWQESFTWKATLYAGLESTYPQEFNPSEYTRSFLWSSDFILRATFLILHAWEKPLSQEQIVSALGGQKHTSVLPSLSSNLEAGQRAGLFIKVGVGKVATFRIADGFRESKRFKRIRFVLTEEARAVIKQRAQLLRKKRRQAQ